METPRKILVIDDDSDIGQMMKMILTYKGYKVTVIENAEGVEELIRNSSFDLIFMDMFLSGRYGVDICFGLKMEKPATHIPIIMMSAHPDAKKICMEAGANDFISKPFDTHELLAKVANLVKNSTGVS